ncbi:complex I subunit 1/NuoH family protein [Bryobacter aggregatus]|uniref:complex I subunit 1/NuoH family protein n=1 Tax=Bryobacter aggregatus TaxID=360054 RepID=UPI0004E28BC7|nr:complex I subunit 1 family protein [Bryobacter aggregatus]
MNFFLLSLIKTGIVAGAFMTTLAYLQWIERKVLAHIQLRLGPYRVGFHGLLQPLADVIKLTTKEGFVPSHVSTFFYVIAPFLAVLFALISICVIPFGPSVEIFGVRTDLGLTDINIGVLFVLAISSVGVYGIALGGWASNNKYSLLGGLRSSAQMISYELPMAIALAAPLLLLNDLSLRAIVGEQAGYYLNFIPRWSIFQMPFPQIFSFFIFLISAFAETNRVPFDLPEAENELVGGFHTEYSSLSFAAFFMAEYANMITVTSMATVLYLGGWHPLWPAEYGSDYVPVLLLLAGSAVLLYHGLFQPIKGRPWDRFSLPFFGLAFGGLALLFLVPVLKPVLIPLFWFVAKTGTLLFLFIWVRGTLPRFRYDQLMNFTWKFLFPVAILNLLITAFAVALQGAKN